MNPKIQVFKEEPGFLKLFYLFKEKYRSLGRIGGNVSLQSFTDVELQSIAGFLGKPVDELFKKGSLALIDFEKELSHTGFSQYNLLQLLEDVLQERIWTKKEEAEIKQNQENEFIEALKEDISQGNWWLEWILVRTPDTRWFWSHYQENKAELYEKVMVVCMAFSSLPKEGEFERLPFFAQRITGNPHYFDNNGAGEKLLLHWMYVDQILQGNKDVIMPKNAGEKNDLLAEYGIMMDDLWSFVTCQGLLASNGNGIHPVWQAAVSTGTVMNVPMKELVKIERIWPAFGTKVWIVENSGVCSTLMETIPSAPIICTHGQIRLAGWQLLDRLVQSNCMLYYSGDIDPEGVVIASRLKKRYKEHLVLWRMDREAYEQSLSNEDISERLPKLNRISNPELDDVISLMGDVKRAGYQEGILSYLISDIRRDIENE